MSDVAAIIAAMVRAGVDADIIGQAAATFAAAKPSDTAAEKRRAYDRDRKRNGKSGGIPVENSGGKSGGIPPESPPLTRVRDITSTSVDRPNLTTPHAEPEFSADVSWPESLPPSKADLDRLMAALLEAAGDAVNTTAPNIQILAPILALARSGAGPPCDLQADVLPVIRARSIKARPGSISAWTFFTAAISEARDKRLSGAPATEPLRPANDRQSSRQPTRRDEQYADHLSGVGAAMAAAVFESAG